MHVESQVLAQVAVQLLPAADQPPDPVGDFLVQGIIGHEHDFGRLPVQLGTLLRQVTPLALMNNDQHPYQQRAGDQPLGTVAESVTAICFQPANAVQQFSRLFLAPGRVEPVHILVGMGDQSGDV